MDRERLVSLGYTFSEKSNGWRVYFRREVIARGSFGCNAQSITKQRSKRRMIEAATAHFVMNRVKNEPTVTPLIPPIQYRGGKSNYYFGMKFFEELKRLYDDEANVRGVEVQVSNNIVWTFPVLGELRRGDNRRGDSADPRNALPKPQPSVRRGQGVHHVRHHRAQKRP